MGLSEKDFCIKCDKRGRVLVCSDSRCPIAVHEECMGFAAKFDEMGKFLCAYCVYRQATEELHQAREMVLSRKKDLSNFLDAKMINGDWQSQETGIPKGCESTRLPGMGKANSACIWIDENRLDKVATNSHSTQLMEAPECSRCVLLYKETDALLDNQNHVLSSKYGDVSGPSDCNHCFAVAGNQTESGPIVACGNECLCSEAEKTAREFEMLEIGNKIQSQPQWQHEDLQSGRIVEQNLNENSLSEPPVTEKTETKGVCNDTDRFEFDGRIIGQEVKKKIQESPAFSAIDPMLQVHLKEKRGIRTSNSICRDSNSTLTGKRAKQNDINRDQYVKANCLRRSPRNSASVLRANADQAEKIHDSRKSRKLTDPAPEIPMILFPNARRKSLTWTDAEEEMLKVGVQKFSTTTNKNIPWRKILEFGRHVFDGSRTPVDLKDKWRKKVAKIR